MYSEAKLEIIKIIDTRKHLSEQYGQKWNMPEKIYNLTKLSWYKSANQNRDNRNVYSEFSRMAEELLIEDIPSIEFREKVDIFNDNRYGFVVNGKDRIFLPPELIKNSGLKNGDNIIAKAVKSFDKKKGRESLAAIAAKKVSN